MSRLRMLCFEPGVRGFEFGDCRVHVLGVEPQLKRESTILVDADELDKQLHSRRPGAHVRRAILRSVQSQPLASDCDYHVTM